MNKLRSIKSISDTKAFSEFSWEASMARKYNLVYGWNGAGKTTIGRILSFFEHKSVHLDGFEGVQFRLQTEHGVISEKDLSTGKLNVKVFNEEFIRSNLSFDDSAANPIVILGEESVETEKEIKELEAKIKAAEETRGGFSEALDKIPDVSEILTNCGTAVVKEFAGTPLASDEYYGRSYNRRRVKGILEENSVTDDNLSSLMIEDRSVVETLKQQVASTCSEVVFHRPDIAPLEGLFERGNVLLRRTVDVKEIRELEEDDELREWVKEGHRLHVERDHLSCYFCTQSLPSKLLTQYGDFFTEEVDKIEQQIADVVLKLQQVEQQLEGDLPDSSDFFPDIAPEFVIMKSQVNDSAARILKACRSMRMGLEHRRGRLQIKGSEGKEVPFPEEGFASAEMGFDKIAQLCEKQSGRLQEGIDEVQKAARKLELHTIASTLSSKDYFKHTRARESLEARVTDLDQEIQDNRTAIGKKQATLRDMALAIKDINALTAEFLGPGEIELALSPDESHGGYRITSRGAPTQYLSEGEKSVIALAYFLAKLREEGGNPENSIVAIDDPVDSQDTVFLFRTYGLLKRRLCNVGQLFVFTHNYEFFNLVRDWLNTALNYGVSRLFWIEMRRENNDRKVVVKDLPALLKDHKSEYQYLFYRLYSRQEGTEMVDDLMVPNIARKVLESFAAFKWSCRSSDDLNNIVQNMFVRSPDKRKTGIGDTVLKFLNEYSHGAEFGRPVTSAVFEAQSICKNVLELIQLSDQEHYKYLLKKMQPHSTSTEEKNTKI